MVELRPLTPGRGAWVCPTEACVARLERQPERIARALGRAAGDGLQAAGGLRETLGLGLRELAIRAIPAAQRSGGLTGGRRKVTMGLRGGTLCAVILASDASPRAAQRCVGLAGALPVARLDLTARALGNLVGKGPRAVLGVLPGVHCAALLAVLRSCASLGYHPGQHRTGDRPEATRRHGTTRSRGLGSHLPPPPAVVQNGSPASAEISLRREG